MGGPGSGGARPNAGAKKKSPRQRMLTGTATPEERELAISPPPIKHAPKPVDLTSAQRQIWEELAPLAEFERTLTNSTKPAFRDLCALIALRDEIAANVSLEGLTIDTAMGLKAHPLLVQFRGVQRLIEAGMIRFRLAPFGKALFEDPKKNDRDDGFDLDADDDDGDDD
jgi:hypothetical protein